MNGQGLVTIGAIHTRQEPAKQVSEIIIIEEPTDFTKVKVMYIFFILIILYLLYFILGDVLQMT